MQSFSNHLVAESVRQLIRNIRTGITSNNFASDTDEPDYDNQADIRMAELLDGSGWDVLGVGANGVVIGHPSKNYVIKLFSTADTAYIAWVNFCKRNQNNPYVPKIRGQVVLINPSILAIRIERLAFMEGLARKFMGQLMIYKSTGKYENVFGLRDSQDRVNFIKAFAFINSNPYMITDLHEDNVGFRYDPSTPDEFRPVFVDPILIRHSNHWPLNNKAFVQWLSHKFRKGSR